MVGGANLAAHAFSAGLVDECHLFIAPSSSVEASHRSPANCAPTLELLDERRFDNGVVYVRHRILI